MFKKTMRTLKIFLIFIFVFEIIFYFYFKLSNTEEKLKNYKINRKNVLSYKYFPEINLVLPKPNTNFIYSTKEFVDTFKTKDVLNSGFGLFDDGVDKNKKVYSVALGDSFTRGLGSIDNLKNGWIELIEKNLKWIDIINLGNLGGGVVTQKYSYDKIKHLIQHDLVILNFSTTLGFVENLDDKHSSYYIEKLKDEKKLSSVKLQNRIDDLNKSRNYKAHLEYLENNKIKSYTFAFSLKFINLLIINKILSSNFLPDYITGESETFRNVKTSKSRLNIVPDDLYELKKLFIDSIEVYNNRRFKVFEVYKNLNMMDRVTSHSADIINNFSKEVELSGRDFIFIILPSKNDVYYPLYRDKIPKNKTIDYELIRESLKSKLNKNIKIIDITKELISYVKDNPDKEIYYKLDNHYNKAGYKLVSKIISQKLQSILKVD